MKKIILSLIVDRRKKIDICGIISDQKMVEEVNDQFRKVNWNVLKSYDEMKESLLGLNKGTSKISDIYNNLLYLASTHFSDRDYEIITKIKKGR